MINQYKLDKLIPRNTSLVIPKLITSFTDNIKNRINPLINFIYIKIN